MSIQLTDDGTLDTVLVCTNCGGEERYNFDGEGEQEYDDFVKWAISDAQEFHSNLRNQCTTN